MGKTFEALNDSHVEFILRQKIFFVATAPLSSSGSVNLSPKGYDSIRILDAHTIAWIDLGGSGIETHAHLNENGRITLMFCAFDGAASILRIYGRGQAVAIDTPGFAELKALFPAFDRARAIIKISIDKVADSCGWGVPFFDFKGEREQLHRHLEHKPLDEWKERRYQTNALSIDGLPGLVRGGEAGST